MRENGLRVEMPDETVVTRVNALYISDLATIRETFDIVFIAVKAYDTSWACELIKPHLAEDGLVIGLQNGIWTTA